MWQALKQTSETHRPQPHLRQGIAAPPPPEQKNRANARPARQAAAQATYANPARSFNRHTRGHAAMRASL
ncbi:hypothetical protein GCM10023174_05180 [Chelativorans composti]|jgi:hypothetical protein